MDIMTLGQLKKLMSKKIENAISIYMPAHRKGAEVEQNPIRFKNLVRDVEKKLNDNGVKKQDIDNILNPAKTLLDDIDFWNDQEGGFAAFISPGEFLYFKVPENFPEAVYISDRYTLRPFFSILNNNERFLILTLNQKNVRLFEADRYNISEIELKAMPTSIDEYLAVEVEDRALQFHSETSRQTKIGRSTVEGGRSAVFHGQGGSGDEAVRKQKILQFFNLVDTGLQKYLNTEKAPLILAGIDYLLPIYRESNSYPYILDETLPGNTQDYSDKELREAAWELIEPRIQENLTNALSQYGNYTGTQRVSDKIEEIIRNVFSNRVLYLFINSNEKIWGKFDLDSFRIVVHYNNYEAQDIDLIDLAAEQTLLHNGNVFSVNADRMPNGRQIAAFFRY